MNRCVHSKKANLAIHQLTVALLHVVVAYKSYTASTRRKNDFTDFTMRHMYTTLKVLFVLSEKLYGKRFGKV